MLSVGDGFTADRLVIGGLLSHAARVAQLVLLDQLPSDFRCAGCWRPAPVVPQLP